MKQIKCKFCGSENVRHNRENTIFCFDCKMCVSRAGNPERMIGHPNYSRYGWRIMPHHEDFEHYKPIPRDMRPMP